MLLRTVALLLLCVSVGMCATLGLYQSQEKDTATADPLLTDGVLTADHEAVDRVADGPAADGDVVEEREAESDTEPADATVGDSAEESVADPLITDELVAETLEVVNSAAVEPELPEAEVPAAAHKPEPEPDADTELSHVIAADAPGVEALADEVLAQERLSEEGNETTTDQASSWSISSVRDSFQSIHGFFDSLVELVGGRDGVCQYRCRYGKSKPHESE